MTDSSSAQPDPDLNKPSQAEGSDTEETRQSPRAGQQDKPSQAEGADDDRESSHEESGTIGD